MKLLTKISCALLAGAALTAAVAQAGNYQQPQIATAATAVKLADDTPVSIKGKIIRALGDEKYELQDSTGIIRVDIDDDYSAATQLIGKTVTVVGEVDIKRIGGVEIDVENVQIH